MSTPTQPDPVTVVDAVRRACVAADGHDPLDEAAALALKNHGTDGARLEVDGDGTGFALVRDGELALAVAPEARGRGTGTALAAALDGAGADRAWSHGDHPAAARLAARHGWTRVRDLWVMRRAVTGPDAAPLPPLVVPGGVEVRGYRDTDADDVLAVNAAAFAHHPEQGALDHAGLAERMAEPWFDPAGLLLAVDTADLTLLGFHWTKQLDEHLGEVYVMAVGPAAQGRGLGKALTLAGLHHLADRGVAQILLYVESDNERARRTYSGLGFTHAADDTHVQYAPAAPVSP
ncbi:mycothiol synthase [Nocardioides marinquilinus]|uniref:Mycothiol acetyltransferase n=1 Tax=Nocardioides marinquilinus TaxID=1210400 RepID=A0ABP9PP01_9ACTN